MGNDLISAAGLIHIIEESRQSALKKVNEELIKMYWKVGEFLSKETAVSYTHLTVLRAMLKRLMVVSVGMLLLK